MSRTFRSPQANCLRNPHHLNEESQLRGLLRDLKYEGIALSGVNRLHKRLSAMRDSWDDIVVSAYLDKWNRK